MDELSSSATMRTGMLGRLEEMRGCSLPEDVAGAMLAVPRHEFVPGVPAEEAYGLSPVVTHRDGQGVATSSASAPGTVAGMLEQAQVRPGQRVLEIGAGTGYNAALLARLVGSSGTVVTVEFDPVVAEAARAHLVAYGADRVRVVTGDGMLGAADDGPFDRILVTAGAWDVASAWWDQLAEGGRLVLPLRLCGLTRVVAFERSGDRLYSTSVVEDGFIPMKGIGAVAETNLPLGPGPDLTLRIDDGRPVQLALLHALDDGPEVVWTEVTAPWAWTPDQDLWLAALPGLCRVFVSPQAVSAGRVSRAKDPWGAWGVFSGGSVGYLTARRAGGTDEMPMLQVGACGFGPEGAELARGLAGRVQAWREETAGDIEVTIEVRRAGGPRLPSEEGALLVVDKTDHVFAVTAKARSAPVDAASGSVTTQGAGHPTAS